MSKIVIDARESGTSTGRYIDKLIEYLYELKPDFEIVVLTKSPRLKFFKQIAPRFEVVESNFKEFTFAEQLGFARQLKNLNADLIHFNAPQQPLLYRGRVVTTVHDLTTARFNNPAKNPLIFKTKQLVYKFVIKRVAAKSSKIIAISNFVKDDLVKFTLINPNKISVIYEAADKISEPAVEIPALSGTSFLMYVGRPTPHKNLKRLIRAFEVLVKEKPGLRLILAGKTDANYERLKKFTVSKNLTSQVIFTGFVKEGELRWLYENCSAYVFPSLSEGFGLPGLEAMAQGAPVIASNATALPEIYGDAAVYFDPLDIEDTADKIASVISSPANRQRLIKSGRRQAAKYSWHRMAEQTLDIYTQTLQKED